MDYQITSEQTYKVVTNQQTNSFTKQVGAPQLPVFTKNFLLPMGSTVTNIFINNQSEALISNNILLYPAQPPRDWDFEATFVPPDSTVYNSSNAYPVNTVVKTGDNSAQGYRIVTLDICPFKYIPSQKKLYLYQTVDISIQYTVGSVEYTEKITKFRQKLTEEWVASQVENPELLKYMVPTAKTVLDEIVETDKSMLRWKPSAYDSYIPDYIIITNEALKSKFEQLADYKTKRGFTTLVVTTEQIYPAFPGMDNAEKIRNYLKAARNHWGHGLFVLLGGDTVIIPERIGSYAFESTDGPSPSDLYYCDVYKAGNPNYNWNQNGNAKFGETGDGIESGLSGDNYIGRAPVDTEQEAQNFVAKIINYEKLNGLTTQAQRSYVNNMLFLGAYFSHVNAGNNSNDPGGQIWHYRLDNEFYLNPPYNSNLGKWRLYDDHDGVNATIDGQQVTIYGNEELSKVSTLNRMNNGELSMGKFHLVSHFDHGGAFGIGVSGRMKFNSIYREDMDALTNGNYLQIMYSTACLSGRFTLDSFAEHYINNPYGGGVASIANTESVYPGAVNQDKKLFRSIYAKGNYILSPDAYLMGVAFANARDAINDIQRRKVLTLFGDPTMMTWSATPGTITLSAPASIAISNSSDNTLTIGINALTEDAVITLYKYNAVTGYPEVLSSQKILKNETSTVFHLNPDTPGELLVTATAKNYLPANTTVDILMPQPHLYITGYTFEDENENHLIEPGENITLNVTLENSGGADINNITALLSCPPELATVTNASVNHEQIVYEGDNIILSGFTFTPLVEMGVDEIPDFIEFHLDIAGSDNYSHLDNFYLDLYSPELNLGARTLTDNSGNPVTTFTPNQTVNVKIAIHNTGNVASSALTAILSSPLTDNGILDITTPNGAYPDIGVYDEKLNLAPFKFKLLQTHSGAMPFTLTLSNAFGQSWEFNFDMSETCPGLISGFDFTSGPDHIKLMWTPVSGIGGYNIYRSDTENGNYDKVNDFLIAGTSAYTDYEVEEATEYYYKISAVSLSGQECALDGLAPHLAWTSLELHGGFPVANSVGRLSVGSPTLYDVDGDGYKEIFLNFKRGTEAEGVIFGYRHDGQEIFNIDGNETTVSGFAITDIAMLPNSAVGDLDNDGLAEVLSVGRNNAVNSGRLYVYRTVDEDEDGKPDSFWETEYLDIGLRTMRNPVLYDLDNDGYLDIIVADEKQRIHVYDHNGNMKPGWPVQVGDADYSEGELAVTDLRGDGFGKIIFGVKDAGVQGRGGIFIFNDDGTPFKYDEEDEEPVVITFAPGERADGGITIANIDADEDFEILLITKINNQGKIHAFKLDGSYVNSNWSNYPQFLLPTGQYIEHIMPRISVGDINNDGNLEIVFGSKNHLYALDKDGVNLPGFPVENVGDIEDAAPILADIDGILDGNGNSDIEIIVNVGGVIKAFKNNGTECVGWRLQSDNGSPFRGSPAIADIDNDGLNEIVISSEDCTAYVWETNGSSDRIEWGSHRADSYNTGTYKQGCRGEVDLFIKDGPTDQGIEPNEFTEYMWNSSDIWTRNVNDGGQVHQNPVYKDNGDPNYIMVRVGNRGCTASSGTETLTVNWAKATTNLPYPDNWNGNMTNEGGHKMGNQVDGTPVVLPIIQPGEEAIVAIPWVVPNPADYMTGQGSENPWHFCLLATILGATDPLTHPYTENPNIMVRENNNQAWKNLTVIELSPKQPIGGTVAVYNQGINPKSFDLVLEADKDETGSSIFNEAEISVVMDSTLYNAWTAGGSQLSKNIVKGFQLPNTPQTFYIQGDHAVIKNIVLDNDERGLISLKFNMLTQQVTNKPKFVYHLVQIDHTTEEIMGGETYEIRKPARPLFYADADDVVADRNEMVTLTAEDINEAAVYNWYDMDGNLIYTGTELTVVADIAKTYQLEIIADADGYKDYTDVNVELNPHKLKSIAPNPAGQSVMVSYNLNAPDSAYISVLGYIGNDTGVERNYILDTESSQYSIDLSNYAIGFYTVRLICDGQMIGSLNLIKE
ncbi:MAG: C25 family cysteine peptidase [Moheibacter sp.]